ncbi:MAG: tyrosine-type recombinase/integrase [Candidatus Moranbacteria bacterium]|nr:tyrosine-type recombinase/integrase [Candidatus Moranbacteria bacterium]
MEPNTVTLSGVELFMNYRTFLVRKKKMAGSSVTQYVRQAQAFSRWWLRKVQKEISLVTPTDVERYEDLLLRNNPKKNTLLRAFSLLRTWFDFLISRKVIEQNPAVGFPKERGDTSELQRISGSEKEKLCNAMDTETYRGSRNQLFITFLYETGAELSVLLGLRFSDVNTTDMVFTLKRQKETLRYPLTNAMEVMLSAHASKYRARDGDYVFASTVNSLHRPLTRQGAWKLFVSYTEKAEINRSITPRTCKMPPAQRAQLPCPPSSSIDRLRDTVALLPR